MPFRRSDLDLNIFTIDITKITEPFTKSPQGFLQAIADKHANASHPFGLLRSCPERPRRRRALPSMRDEIAAFSNTVQCLPCFRQKG